MITTDADAITADAMIATADGGLFAFSATHGGASYLAAHGNSTALVAHTAASSITSHIP